MVILDFHEELPSEDFDCSRAPVPLDSDPVAAVDRAIAEQSPEDAGWASGLAYGAWGVFQRL